MQTEEEALKALLKETIAGIELDDVTPALPSIPNTVFNIDVDLDIDDDYRAARHSIRSQLEYFKTATETALAGLISSQHPRSVEAFASLMGQMTNTAEKLIKLQSDTKKAKGTYKSNGEMPMGASNNCTTNDLLGSMGDALSPKYILDDDEE